MILDQPETLTGETIRYLRLSTAKQEDGYSLIDQDEETKAIAVADGSPDGGIVLKETGSAESMDERPTITDIRRRVRAGKVKEVIFPDLDRMSRDLLDQQLFLRECEEHDVVVKFARFKYTPGDDSSFFETVIRGMFAQRERKMTRERTHKGRLRRVKEGMPLKGPGHYGHVWEADPAPARTGRFIKNPSTWRYVRFMGRLVLAGRSTRAIAKALNDHGVPPPGHSIRYKNGPKGAKWYPGRVSAILSDPAYAGRPLGWKYQSVKIRPTVAGQKATRKNMHRDEAYPLRDDTYEPIFTWAEFLEIQKILDANKARGRRSTREPEKYLLRGGFVVCAGCGKAMTGRMEAARGKKKPVARYIYYCQNYAAHRKTPCPSPASIGVDILDRIVIEAIKHALQDANVLRHAIETSRDDDGVAEQLEAARQELAEQQAIYKTATDLQVRAEVEGNTRRAAMFEQQITAAEDLIGRIEDRIRELEVRHDAWQNRHQLALSIDEWRRHVASEFDAFDWQRKRAAFELLGLHVVVHRPDNLERVEIFVHPDITPDRYRSFSQDQITRHTMPHIVSPTSWCSGHNMAVRVRLPLRNEDV